MRVAACGVALLIAWPLAAAVPAPESHFGHPIGADRTVLDWDRVVSYFRELEKNSPRIRVQELGKTAEGKPLIAAILAAPDTVANLGRYIEIQKKLADPRIAPPGEVETLIAQGKSVVMITCSIHSTELASTHTAVEFAYRLLTEDKPRFRAILVQEMNLIGMGIATDLTAAGKTGVSVHASYDFWAPSRHYQSFHGGLRILTESASARLASPVDIRREDLREDGPGYNAQERTWNHIEPWAGGRWRLRDIIDYQSIAMESCLYQAAVRREDLLRNFFKVGQRQIGRKTPYAFYIPAKQADPGATRKLIETLVAGMVDVEIEADGAHTIRMSQPYSGYAKALLERQNYPDLRQYPGGPPMKPYDVTAHTLPLLMGVAVRTLNTPLLPTGVVSAVLERPGRLPASDTDSWRAVNRLWNMSGSVWRDPVTGDFSPSSQGKDWKQIKRPRIGLYKSFMP